MKTNENELKPYKRAIAAEDPNKPVKSPIYLDMEYTSVYRYPFNILYSAKYIPFWYNFKWSDRSIFPISHISTKNSGNNCYHSKTTLEQRRWMCPLYPNSSRVGEQEGISVYMSVWTMTVMMYICQAIR